MKKPNPIQLLILLIGSILGFVIGYGIADLLLASI